VTERQIAALVTRIDSGLPCDAEGKPFANELDATCIVFDSFSDARAFSEQAVGRSRSAVRSIRLGRTRKSAAADGRPPIPRCGRESASAASTALLWRTAGGMCARDDHRGVLVSSCGVDRRAHRCGRECADDGRATAARECCTARARNCAPTAPHVLAGQPRPALTVSSAAPQSRA